MLNTSVLHRNKPPTPCRWSLCVSTAWRVRYQIQHWPIYWQNGKDYYNLISLYPANHLVRGPPCCTLRPAAIFLNYVHTLKITQASSCRKRASCKYLGIILQSDLYWVDQANYRAQKAWKALHFVMRVLNKKGNRYTKNLAHTSLEVLFLNMGLASVQRTDKCVRPSTAGSCSILQIIRRNLTGKPWLSVAR